MNDNAICSSFELTETSPMSIIYGERTSSGHSIV